MVMQGAGLSCIRAFLRARKQACTFTRLQCEAPVRRCLADLLPHEGADRWPRPPRSRQARARPRHHGPFPPRRRKPSPGPCSTISQVFEDPFYQDISNCCCPLAPRRSCMVLFVISCPSLQASRQARPPFEQVLLQIWGPYHENDHFPVRCDQRGFSILCPEYRSELA